MKTIIIAVVCLLLTVGITSAQNTLPPHSCGLIVSLSVVHQRVSSDGYAPRMSAGSQSQFDCIAAHDPNFASQRFSSAVQSGNYWLSLLSAELGVTLIPLPI